MAELEMSPAATGDHINTADPPAAELPGFEEVALAAAYTAPPPPPPVAQEADIEVIGHAETDIAPDAPRWTYTRSSAPAHFLTVPSLGPVGRRRHPIVVGLLTVFSLGGYVVAWHDQVNGEISDFDARVDVRPGRSALAVLLPWLAGLVTTATGAALLGLRLTGHPVAGITLPEIIALCCGLAAVGLVTVFFPPSLMASLMTVERVRRTEERVGIGSEAQIHPVRRMVVLALPGIGLVAHIVGVQRRLNAVWSTVAPRSSRES
jgi:hypothetical protein